MIPKRLPKIPKCLFVTPVEVKINQTLSESGAPVYEATFSGLCVYSDKAHYVQDAEGQKIRLNGHVIVEGDIAPGVTVLANGVATINGTEFTIYQGKRPRNPDGSIHHTGLELM